jgi:hypothetical protein
MKRRERFVALAMLVLAPFFGIAQCVSPMQISYDTLVTGSGNDWYSFEFPKFDGKLGTLTEVHFTSVVTLKYQFELENKEPGTISNYRVRMVRMDDLMSTALQNPLSTTTQKTYGPYTLRGNNGVTGSGPDYMSVGPMYSMDHDTIHNVVFNTADYLGSGTVMLDYASTTYSAVLGSVNNIFNGTADDTMHFTITYRYCPTSFLASDVSGFSAFKREDNIILRWQTLNENPDRVYQIERSTDGKKFTTIGQLTAKAVEDQVAQYQFTDAIAEGESGKVIFRLRQVEKDGTVKYSGLRIVDLGKKPQVGLRVFPNPAKNSVQIVFNNTKKGDWQVDIYGANGQLMDRSVYYNALLARINLTSKFSRGVYVIKALNKKTQEQYVERLMVQ